MSILKVHSGYWVFTNTSLALESNTVLCSSRVLLTLSQEAGPLIASILHIRKRGLKGVESSAQGPSLGVGPRLEFKSPGARLSSICSLGSSPIPPATQLIKDTVN